MANGIPASRILCLALVSRLLIVSNGTRNARAISSVDRPPRVRRVSGTCLEGERRVTAGEDQLQPLVRDGGGVVHEGLRWLWPGLEVAGEQRRLCHQDLLAAQLVDGAVTRGRDQPAGGVGRFPVAWPAFGGDGECPVEVVGLD